jgi:hypothetical protein
MEEAMPKLLESLARTMMIVVLMLVAFGPVQTVQAHEGSKMWVTQLDSTRPAPTVDGNCTPQEYSLSRTFLIYYAPRIPDTNPARIQAVWKDEYLYICISSLLVDTGYDDIASVAFDVFNNGLAKPQTDDILFSYFRTNGHATASRGNGSGFVQDNTLNGYFSHASGYQDESHWQIEWRFSRSLFAKGVGSWYRPGIHIRHNWLRWTGDDYAYPAQGYWDGPYTWADMLWAGTSTTTMDLFPDVMRITQGMDVDAAHGGTAYDKIAGKDTLVRVQVYTFGAITTVTGASCQVQQLSHLSNSGVRTAISSSPITVPASLNPLPVILPIPVGFFNGTNTVDCWIPAGVLFDPGDYSFRMTINRVGAVTNSFSVGVRTFYPTADVRILFYPAVFPPSHPEYRLWSESLWSQLFVGMRQYARFNPYHSGAGPFDTTGMAVPSVLGGKPGVRTMPYPYPYSCSTRPSETITDTVTRCDNTARATASRLIGEYNAEMDQLDIHSPGLAYRDRFDWAAVLWATPHTGGGQSCHFDRGERSVGEGVDTLVTDLYGNVTSGGVDGRLIGHEVNHCMGLVAATSPNSDGHFHTSQGDVDTLGTGARMINMETHQTINSAGSQMYAWFAHGTDGSTYLTGIEWNQLRRTLLTMARPPLPPLGPALASPGDNQDLFQISGTIDPSGAFELISAQMVDDLDLETTTPAVSPSYDLRFIDQYDTIIGTYGIEPFASAPDDPSPSYGSFYVVTPLPEGTTRIELMEKKYQTVIYSSAFTSSKPEITDVMLSVKSGGKSPTSPAVNASLTWSGSDPDSTDLSYAIYLLPAPGKAPMLLADGLKDTYFSFPSDFAPASSQAKFLIEASDGYNTTVYTTTSFVIPQNPPAVYIVSPTPYNTLVAGVPFQLAGLAYDFTGTSLSEDTLTWSSDLDGTLGHGEQLSVTLSVGVHTITLEAVAGGQTGNDSTTLTVSADSDHDGLPDDYEDMYFNCMSSSIADGQSDPDEDGLLNRGEFLQGTNPCNPDTDMDGVGDGDEIRLGSDPLDDTSVPAVPALFIEETTINLGTCPDATGVYINLQTDPAQSWTLTASDPWFTGPASGTGSMSIPITPVCEGLPSGRFTGQAMLSAEGIQPRLIDVILDVSYKIYLPMVKKN